MRASRWIRAVVALGLTVSATAAAARGGADVAGAGAAPFPAGTTFNLVTLQGLQLGLGATASPEGAVIGDVHLTLVGTSALGVRRDILYDAKVHSLSVSDGTATLVGAGTLDTGDGTAPLVSVPFTMTATVGTVLLMLGTTSLPEVNLSQGDITIK